MARSRRDAQPSSAVVRIWRQFRRIRLDRVVPAAAVTAAVVLVLVEGPLAAGTYRIPVPVAFALALVHAAGLPIAVRHPNIGAPVSLAAALLLQAASASVAVIWPWWPVLIVVQALVLTVVAIRASWIAAAVQWLLALGTPLLLVAVMRPAPDPAVTADVVVFGAVSAGLMLVAALGSRWRRLRSELLHERAVAAADSERLALVEERTRIARELHDVVAHSLSLITVQSSTARFRHAGFSAEAVAEFDRIGTQSRLALDEMRGLLRVLRSSGDDAGLRPQPGLEDLAALIAQSDDAGPGVTMTTPAGDWMRGVGAVTGLATYRIVQEATSNALRHAPGAPVAVRVTRPAGAVEITVTNPAPAVREVAQGGGHGLIGMAERAASTGGSLRFGPTADGGWAVHALLPTQPAHDSAA